MNKKLTITLLTITSVVSVGGRQLFTPLSLQWDERQYLHDLKAGGKWDKVKRTDRLWTFDLWGAGYNRFADNAFTCKGSCPCLTPLTTLFFSKSEFTLREMFADSTVYLPANPWVSISSIKPNIEYNEQGAFVGAQWSTDVKFMSDRTFRFGIRGNMPVKMVKVERRYNGSDTEREIETKDDAVKYARESICGGHVTETFAFRYDLVNQLIMNQTTGDRMIKYTEDLNNHIRIADKDVSQVEYGVHVKGSTGKPVLPLGACDVASLPILAADGSGVSTNSRARFDASVNYTDLDAAAATQRTLWIVPSFNDGTMTTDGDNIKAAIESALRITEDSVVDYMERRGLDFSTQKTMGAGDLLLQMFLQRNWHNKKIFTEAQFGVVFPTGVKACNTLKPFAMPLGNNGHYEVEAGLDLGWNSCNWAALQAGFSYHWALKGVESVAAPFDGAGIKNIGPCVRAKTSWNYLLTDLNLTLTEPLCHNFGINMGYEFYYKTCDKICLCATQAENIEGATHDLCASNLTKLTKVRSHKAKAEMFYNKACGSIFGGFDYIFAGRNAPKEIGWHLGLLIEF